MSRAPYLLSFLLLVGGALAARPAVACGGWWLQDEGLSHRVSFLVHTVYVTGAGAPRRDILWIEDANTPETVLSRAAYRPGFASASPRTEPVQLAFDDCGDYLAGVGIKRHDRFGHVISVGTEPHARGQGIARRPVAQAARHILDQGRIPTYLHTFDNVGSSRVAAGAGFPDLGWSALMLSDEPAILATGSPGSAAA